MIGFVRDNHMVTEGVDEFASITVEVISGQLGREVVVVFDTKADSTASMHGKLATQIYFKFPYPNRWIGF